MPKLSVIIPAYNVEDEIKKCIDSILNQTFNDFEIIVINDGSRDSTLKILNDTYKNNKKIKIYDQTNIGPALTRNKGIALSNSKYIMFIDSDDYVDKNYLMAYISEIIKCDYDMVIGGYKRIINNKVTSILRLKKGEFSKYLVTGPVCRIVKKSFLDENKILFLDTNSSEDIFFNVTVYNKTRKIGIIDNIDYNYVFHSNSLSNTAHKGLKSDIKILDLLDKINFKKSCNLEMNQYFIIKYCIWYLLFSGRSSNYKVFIKRYNELFNWLNDNIPEFLKNKYISFFIPFEEPLLHKIIIKTFIVMHKIKFVKIFARFYCKGD